jgi:hypothetical protein
VAAHIEHILVKLAVPSRPVPSRTAAGATVQCLGLVVPRLLQGDPGSAEDG